MSAAAPPARQRPPWRRGGAREAVTWSAPGGADIGLYVLCNYLAGTAPSAPFEIFVRPRGPEGSLVSFYADDLGEALSLLLQHGHTLPALRRRFKPGSLARCAIEAAWRLAADAGVAAPMEEP